MTTSIITDDIFTKAAIRYAERIGVAKGEQVHFATHEDPWSGKSSVRDEMADLMERIGALKDVGAL